MTDTTRPGDPADKAIDAKADGAFQGSHRAGYGDRLARVEEWLRKHPSATLGSGEGAVLLAEIDRLRAAIDRVRALHRPDEGECGNCHIEDSGRFEPHPCPTLRALDGEGA
jgi:hypothetical protein